MSTFKFDRIIENVFSLIEKKGKDLTGDGKIDKDDYFAARDAAIKKAKFGKKAKKTEEDDKD
jgi:hypothetical protein